jgi:hypothetical protein
LAIHSFIKGWLLSQIASSSSLGETLSNFSLGFSLCAQSVNKIITMQNLNEIRFLLTKWKLNMRKTTQGQLNPGYPLF